MEKTNRNLLKEWWNQCPDKRVINFVNVALIILSIFGIYEVGYILGKFLYHLGF